MSTALSVRLLPEALRSVAFGGISGTYAGIGTAILNPARIVYIVNTTDVLVTISMDGVVDHFVIPPMSYILIDVTSNKSLLGGAFSVAQGTRFYVKGAPTLGSVYLTVFYGSNG